MSPYVPRVLLLGTPIGPASHLNGATLALVDLARALVARGLARPVVLVRPGTAPPQGCEAVETAGGGARALVDLVRARRDRIDVVHALFAPRITTSLVLSALRRITGARLVQTIASVPASGRFLPAMLVGDVVVAASRAVHATVESLLPAPRRLVEIPLPFAPPVLPPQHPRARPRPGPLRPLFLYVGDYEPRAPLDDTLAAFAQMQLPHGVRPTLAIAARTKTGRASAIERSLDGRLERAPEGDRVVAILGEPPSLLPWLARAKCALLPARSTYAKLDHPRALLEAIALGTRIVVGAAPSLRELVVDPSLGEVASDEPALREAMERALEPHAPDVEAVATLLDARRPARIAAAYAEIYRG